MVTNLPWRNWSLTAKFALVILLLVSTTVLAITLLSLQREYNAFRSELQLQADLLLNTLTVSVDDALYTLDSSFLSRLVEDLEDSGTNVTARIYDAEGRLIADSEIGGRLSFSMATDPQGQRLVTSDAILYEWQAESLMAGKAVTVGRQRLGAVSITLPTTSLAVKMDEVRNEGIAVALVTGTVGFAVALLFSQSIARPLRHLIQAAEEIANGQLQRRVTTDGGGELKALEVSFNTMTTRLQDTITHLETQSQQLTDANHQLSLERERAEESTRLKSQFLATMSHELRTPMNAIMGYTEIQLAGMGGPVTNEQKNYLERILVNSEHLLNIINNVLDISKIESGRLELSMKPFQLRQWIDEIVGQVKGLADKKNLTFDVTVQPDLPETIVGDAVCMKQIVINLLSNAIKFTDSGSVELRMERQDDTQLAVVVKDTGMGIPANLQESVFEEFRQVDGTFQRKQGGTGLGLAIVRRLAVLMGGSVHLQSSPGAGSTFTVRLPLVEEPELASA